MRPFAITRTLVLLALAAAPALLRAEDNNCNADRPLPTTHEFLRLPSDTVTPTHLELDRPFTGTGHLELNLCRADLQLRSRPNLDHLHLVIDLRPRSGAPALADYVRRISVQPDTARFDLPFPEDAHATVTLELPMRAGSSSEINLGKGDLDFNTIGGDGTREVNLGMGHLNLITGGDRSYNSLELNIGMGTLHDHRPGGHNGHFVIARTDAGSGPGSLEINVGMGTVDIRE